MIKLTKKRKIVYSCLKNANKPLNAEMIYENLINEDINLSTIYRAIEFLENNNLLLKFHFNNKSYYIVNDETHSHYFICTNCLSTRKISCKMDNVLSTLKDDGFTITNHEMTVYGLCNSCN